MHTGYVVGGRKISPRIVNFTWGRRFPFEETPCCVRWQHYGEHLSVTEACVQLFPFWLAVTMWCVTAYRWRYKGYPEQSSISFGVFSKRSLYNVCLIWCLFVPIFICNLYLCLRYKIDSKQFRSMCELPGSEACADCAHWDQCCAPAWLPLMRAVRMELEEDGSVPFSALRCGIQCCHSGSRGPLCVFFCPREGLMLALSSSKEVDIVCIEAEHFEDSPSLSVLLMKRWRSLWLMPWPNWTLIGQQRSRKRGFLIVNFVWRRKFSQQIFRYYKFHARTKDFPTNILWVWISCEDERFLDCEFHTRTKNFPM